MKNILALLILMSVSYSQAQQPEKFNLRFEKQTSENKLSDGWIKWGNYDLTIDTIAHSGKRAGKITADERGSSFGSLAYKIPANYKGHTITLEGFMKLKNVKDGYAGLILRVDGNGGSLAFNNMNDQNISGTVDWKKYSITLDYPEQAKTIYVGGILTGKGEAWFDDLVISIDGKDLQTTKEVKKELSKADLDTEFDNGSSIELSNLTSKKIEDLELLGKVWGFLKYHHPAITKGNYNCDYELFRFLPNYISAKTIEERNNLLISWIDSLGKIDKCKSCKSSDRNSFMKPDQKWIANQEAALRNKLLSIYNNRSQGKQYYIEMSPSVGNPKFLNEHAYSDKTYPDDGFRLLSLYRYWNMIHYFYPNRQLTDKDWNSILKEYIAIFINADNELEYEKAAIQIIAEVKDTHANLYEGADMIDQEKGTCYPPVHVRFLEDKLVVTDYYNADLKKRAGLEIGDVITKINGKSVDEILEEKSKYYPASNVPTRLRNISVDILRSNSENIEIEYFDKNGEKQTTDLKLYPKESINFYSWFKESSSTSYKMLDNNIGYVTLQTIKDEDIEKIKNDFKDTKGIIIDIRNYPSTFVPFSLGSYFVSSSTPFVKFTNGNINNPGEFEFTDVLKIPHRGKTYKGKLVVLINELSQSQAEYTAMAFKAGDNTTVIGSTTAGADGNISSIVLPGGLRTVISGIGVFYPNGEDTQRVGIVPDIEVIPTVKGIREGRDELMEKAIEAIDNSL